MPAEGLLLRELSPASIVMPTAVITGSSSGIGRQTALEFARQGYSVLLHARRNLAGLQQTAGKIRKLAWSKEPKVRCITADISCSRSRRDLVETAFAWKDDIQVWVNNAGADVLTGTSRLDSFDKRLAKLWDVDVNGTIQISRLVADRMSILESANQSIINMGWDQSQLGMEGEPGQLFCTTKAAVEAFTRSLAMSVSSGIRVNCVAPGWIQTAWGQQSSSEYWEKRARDESLAGRWGTAEDVANCITWLASSQAQFISGQVVNVNGGRRFYPQ